MLFRSENDTTRLICISRVNAYTYQFPRLLCRGSREAVTDDHGVILDVTPCGKKCLELVKLVPHDPCQLIYASHALDSSWKLLVPCRLIPFNDGRRRPGTREEELHYTRKRILFRWKENSWSVLTLRIPSRCLPYCSTSDLTSTWISSNNGREETLKSGTSVCISAILSQCLNFLDWLCPLDGQFHKLVSRFNTAARQYVCVCVCV